MQITNTMKSNYEYSQVLMKKKAPRTSGKASSFSEAVTKVEQKEKGKRKLLNYFADHFKKTSSALEDVTKTDSITDSSMDVNASETVTVQAKFPLDEVDAKGNPKEDIYMIAVDKNGIRCTGKKEYEWEILFTDESQYEKAREFLDFAGGLMDNFRFAAHKNFWEDYLNGNMAVDEFKEFLQGTNNGIPDYFFTVGDSTHIDEEKVQWAKYMNPFGAKFFTAEEYDEMLKRQAELFQENIPYLNRLSTPYSIIYKQMHPEYNGERMFCEYPGGPLYTADEIMEVMNRNAQDAEYQAKARGIA